ncbi:hypothetical protein HWV62_20081 [Athelia sp. TMB]|nr:hypothetical protein HWV62_25537 [Athelia sp. TMB]KAF7971717.1 hypothetical protein HWV62_20081 [Athelia sp. TMB]
MALNWAMIGPDGTPVPLPHEQTIKTIDSGVELSLTIPDAPPSSSSNAGGSGGTKKLKESGRLWLTDQRPMFGANYLSFEIKPSPEGGLADGTKAEIRLKDKGIFEFVGVVEKTRERAIYMKRQKAEEEEEDGLPVYTSPTTVPTGSSQALAPPADGPPGYDASI